MTGKVGGVGNLSRTGLLDVGDVGVNPDDFGAVVVVEMFESLTGIARNLAEFDGVGDALAGDKRPRGKARLAHLAEDLPKAARESGEDQGVFKKRKATNGVVTL